MRSKSSKCPGRRGGDFQSSPRRDKRCQHQYPGHKGKVACGRRWEMCLVAGPERTAALLGAQERSWIPPCSSGWPPPAPSPADLSPPFTRLQSSRGDQLCPRQSTHLPVKVPWAQLHWSGPQETGSGCTEKALLQRLFT